MTKLCRTSPVSGKASALSLRLALTCAVCALAACGQGSSASNTTANAVGDNSLADAPPPATALPLSSGPAPAYRPAPVASALPPAPSARLGRVPPSDQYAYLNQAYAFTQSLADAPPDYSYDYQGEAPWVWQSPDGYYRVAERLPTGVRYFYYAPGASEPYLIQDPQYAYGYSGGELTVVYGRDGQVLPYDDEARQARAAGAYLARAAGLYDAARHQQHVAVYQDRWNAERQAVYADQARWNAAQQRNSAWAAYSQAHQNDQAHWADQRYVRAAEAARFAQAVHDPSALAHAQHAAVQARATVAQRYGERRQPQVAAAPESAAGGLAATPHQQVVTRPESPQGQRETQTPPARGGAEGPRTGGPRPGDPRLGDPRIGAPRTGEHPGAAPVRAEPQTPSTAIGAPVRQGQSREMPSRDVQGRASQTQPAHARQMPASTEARPTEARPIESRPTEARPPQARPTEARGPETKPTEARQTQVRQVQVHQTQAAPPAARPSAAPTESAQLHRGGEAPARPPAARPAPHPAPPAGERKPDEPHR